MLCTFNVGSIRMTHWKELPYRNHDRFNHITAWVYHQPGCLYIKKAKAHTYLSLTPNIIIYLNRTKNFCCYCLGFSFVLFCFVSSTRNWTQDPVHGEQAIEPHLQTLVDLNIIILRFCFPVLYTCDAHWITGHGAHVNCFLRLSELSQGSIHAGSKPYDIPCAQDWSLT